jgi:hypothetical protein
MSQGTEPPKAAGIMARHKEHRTLKRTGGDLDEEEPSKAKKAKVTSRPNDAAAAASNERSKGSVDQDFAHLDSQLLADWMARMTRKHYSKLTDLELQDLDVPSMSSRSRLANRWPWHPAASDTLCRRSVYSVCHLPSANKPMPIASKQESRYSRPQRSTSEASGPLSGYPSSSIRRSTSSAKTPLPVSRTSTSSLESPEAHTRS